MASPPPQSEEARRARVLSQVWKVLRGAPQMPPDSADALAVLVAALFSDEIGLEPRDLPWLVEDFIAQAVALAGDDWQWGDDETRAVVAVRVFLGVVFQNRGDDAFARWVGDEVREELVATLLDTFDVLHENARAFLAGVLVDDGMLEGEAPAQLLRRLMELEPVPPSIARIARDTGVPAEVRTAVREGTDSWERFQARRRP